MDLDIRIGNESFPVAIEKPFDFDMSTVMDDVVKFGNRNGVNLEALKLDQLIPKMIRGVAGCEAGCPADAHRVVREGFGEFRLEYVEGGILTATQVVDNGKRIEVKLFPDF